MVFWLLWRFLFCSSAFVLVLQLLAGCHDSYEDVAFIAPGPHGVQRLQHLVIIYLENRSFDNLYGSYPRTEGLDAEGAEVPQIDLSTGEPYKRLPQSDPSIPPDLANHPFDIGKYAPMEQQTMDLVSRYYHEQAQIDGGRMDRFVAVSDAQGLSVGYYKTGTLPMAQKLEALGHQVTMFDHFFHAAFGGSFLNHMWLVSANTPTFPGAPDSLVAKIDASGALASDGSVDPFGFAINTLYSANNPHPSDIPDAELLPSQTQATIGDRLSERGVSWGWFAGGYREALAGRADPSFQYDQQPFLYFENFAEGTAERKAHLWDEQEFLQLAEFDDLPEVSFVKPIASQSEHPGYGNLASGEAHLIELIDALTRSPSWQNTAVFVTYDDNGGFFDHVAPPAVDIWGPGCRVPTFLISPFAKAAVDPTVYDTTALLKLIEERWELPPLSSRDAAQPSLLDHAFKFPK